LWVLGDRAFPKCLAPSTAMDKAEERCLLGCVSHREDGYGVDTEQVTGLLLEGPWAMSRNWPALGGCSSQSQRCFVICFDNVEIKHNT
jgi:hypothetical protein